jgi:hypothetical protein
MADKELRGRMAACVERRGNMSTSFRDVTSWNGGRLVRLLRRAVVIALILIAVLFVGTAWLIGSGVHAASDGALRDQPGDRVLALMACVESPKHTLRARNRAVWALGQLGDARALPVLEKHFTGGECDHDRLLCQHELRKAIRLCRGATNISAWIWR